MPHRNCNILSIAPYRILPPSSGGQLCIVYGHHYMGKLCQDHVVSTVDNGSADDHAFELHKIFTSSPKHYLPFFKYTELLGLARKYDVNYIFCEHPYMFPTAMALGRKLKIPWFIRSHNIESERFRTLGKQWWPFMRVYEQFAMRHANGNFFITPEDRDWAVANYHLRPGTCHLMPYGTTLSKVPSGHGAARISIADSLNVNDVVPWLYFLGALDYLPNSQAVTYILDEVLPRLNKKNIQYQLLIAGRGLSEELRTRVANTPNVLYTGFLADVGQLVNACDIMLNPVLLGGGLKTKAIEALGYNKIVVSSYSGAAGLLPEVCGDNLLVSPDNDWDAFTEDIVRAIPLQAHIPNTFYDTYYWGNIAQNVLNVLKNYQG